MCGCQGTNADGTVQDSSGSIESPLVGSSAEENSDQQIQNNQSVSKVYMTKNVTPDGLMAVYEALGKEATGKVAIKLHMGEPGNDNYLSPDLLKKLVLSVNGTFVDTNIALGARSNTAMHLQVAKDHGFTYAPVDILDSEGEIALPVNGGIQQKEALVGSHLKNYDFVISIAHFKGHILAGFGGTFKNIAVGMASVNGKWKVHVAQKIEDMYNVPQEVFLENVAEYAKAVVDDRNGNILYINVLNNLSVDCDCVANASAPEMKDIGILASLDPVALDRASVDLVYASPDEGKKHLIEKIESRNGTLILADTERLGLGSQKYELVTVDE
jgi:uncharacterized Fe-S center protein